MTEWAKRGRVPSLRPSTAPSAFLLSPASGATSERHPLCAEKPEGHSTVGGLHNVATCRSFPV